MADIFTPAPPPAPADCAVAPPAARSPSPKWLEDYFGPKPQPPGSNTVILINNGDGLWAPPGMGLEYLGHRLIVDESEVDAITGFTIHIPADEVWRLNTVSANWSSNTQTGFAHPILFAYDNDFDRWVLRGQTDIPYSSGGTVTFAPGSWGKTAGDADITETLPPRWYMWGQLFVIFNFWNSEATKNFVEHVRWDVDCWRVVPLPTSTAPPSGGGAGGNPFGGPYFVEE